MTNSDIFDHLRELYNDNISTILGKITSNDLAMYVIILVTCLFVSKFINVSLSNLFFIILAVVIIYYIYSKRNIAHLPLVDDLQTKLKLIMPEPQRLSPKYSDLINFLYNIREYYFINPTEFASLVTNIDNFIQLYEGIMLNHIIYCVENLEVAVDFYQKAQNNLHSVIYGLTTNPDQTKRFHTALQFFSSIMEKYINQLVNKCNKRFRPKNINNSSKYYDAGGPKPINYFDLDNKSSVY